MIGLVLRETSKTTLRKFFYAFGLSIGRRTDKVCNVSIELDESDARVIESVYKRGFTMTEVSSLVNTLKSCKYAVENDIPGDFVECGVWRGGHGIVAKKVFERMNSEKKVWMFDTFEGMTKPTEIDVDPRNKNAALPEYIARSKTSHTEWCYSSLEEVQRNFISFDIDPDEITFIKGDVCETLSDCSNLPKSICVLRLDTDWYKSTKIELEVLYPLLCDKGVLIVDDYGAWEGARKAVDEYFEKSKYKPLFNVVNMSARSAIKHDLK